MSPGNLLRAQGAAKADHPEGSFVNSELNPVTNSGHETMNWHYEGGIATLLILDGPDSACAGWAEFRAEGACAIAATCAWTILPGCFCR